MPRPSNGDLRRAILDAARSALLEKGYTQLSLRPLARSVGCTATSIYLHFPNKDGLIHALIDEGMDLLHERLEAASSGVGDPEARVRALTRAYLDFGIEQSEYYEIMFMLHPERMERYPAEKYRKARRNLDLFAEALAGLTGRSVAELQLPATIIWSSLHGLVALLIARRIDIRLNRDALLDEAVEQAVRLAAGWRKPAAGPPPAATRPAP